MYACCESEKDYNWLLGLFIVYSLLGGNMTYNEFIAQHKDFAKESVFCGIHIARKGEMPGKKVYSESDLW